MAETYFLCRPRGGLNDMLCQIELAYRYCRKHRRVLIIDTARSGMRDDFFKYFTFRPGSDVQVVGLADVPVDLDTLTTLPDGIKGRVTSYQPEYVAGFDYTDPQNGQSLNVDLGQAHDAQLLVRETNGGGINSYWLLQHLLPTQLVLDALARKLETLPQGFVSMHIRNTDLQTDYRSFVQAIEWALRGREVLVGTDSGEIQAALPRLAPETHFHFLTELDPKSTQPLHDSTRTTEQGNLDMLTDLFALALGSKLYFTFTQQGYISGFSGLAYGLSHSKLIQHVRRELDIPNRKPPSNRQFKGAGRYLRNQSGIIAAKIGIAFAMRLRERRIL